MDQFHRNGPAIPFPFSTPSYATINRIFSITYLEKYEQTHRNINEKREKKEKKKWNSYTIAGLPSLLPTLRPLPSPYLPIQYR